MFILITNENNTFLDIILNNNVKLYVKGDQAYKFNLQP